MKQHLNVLNLSQLSSRIAFEAKFISRFALSPDSLQRPDAIRTAAIATDNIVDLLVEIADRLE